MMLPEFRAEPKYKRAVHRDRLAAVKMGIVLVTFTTAFAQHAKPAPQSGHNQHLANSPRSGGQQAAARHTPPLVPSGTEHLPIWLSRNRNLPPQQQDNLLRQERGFNHLPSWQQQRLINTLHGLNEKSPAEQRRILRWNEAFERLTPQEKQQVRAASQALQQLAPGRRQMMVRAFHDLRQLPPTRRSEILTSARFLHDYSSQERQILARLLTLEP